MERDEADAAAACPVEWPVEPRAPSRWRWVWLAVFAIIAATAILIASGLRNAA